MYSRSDPQQPLCAALSDSSIVCLVIALSLDFTAYVVVISSSDCLRV